MSKKTTTVTVLEYDPEGKLIKETVTETVEDVPDSNPIPYIPSYPMPWGEPNPLYPYWYVDYKNPNVTYTANTKTGSK